MAAHRVCPRCGHKTAAPANFCSYCNNALSPGATPQQSAPKKRKSLIPVISAAIAGVAVLYALIGSPSASQPRTVAGIPTGTPGSLTSSQLVSVFSKAGLEVGETLSLSSADYEEYPGPGVDGSRFLLTSLCDTCAGQVIRSSNFNTLKKLQTSYFYLGPNSAPSTTWVFTKGEYILYLYGNLPKDQAQEYERVLNETIPPVSMRASVITTGQPVVIPVVAAVPTGRPSPPSTSAPPPPSFTPRPTAIPVIKATLAKAANMRFGPAVSFGMVGTLQPGDEVTVLEYQEPAGDRWYHVRLSNGANGWVSGSLLPIDSEAAAIIPMSKVTFTIPPTSVPAAPVAPPPANTGARTGAICGDGSRSYATGRGACSSHGGVARWLYGP